MPPFLGLRGLAVRRVGDPGQVLRAGPDIQVIQQRVAALVAEVQLRDGAVGVLQVAERDRLGREVWIATLPGGSASRAVFEIAREAGYRVVMTSRPGVNTWKDDLFEMNRFAVRRGYTPERVAALARGESLSVIREKARRVALRAARMIVGNRRYRKMHDR